MNKVELSGRTTKDVEIRKTTSGISVARFTLAVERSENGKSVDYISCIAWRGLADQLANCSKGTMVSVVGRIQTGSYDKNGQRVFTTDVVCENVNVDNGYENEQEEQEELPF